MLKAIAARSVDLLVDLQMSAVSKTSLVNDASNLADKPGKEESQKKDVLISVDRSCRIMVQMIADNQSVVANQTLDNLNVQAKPWTVRFANLQPFRRYLASVFQQCGGSESGESQCSSQRTKLYQMQFMTNEGCEYIYRCAVKDPVESTQHYFDVFQFRGRLGQWRPMCSTRTVSISPGLLQLNPTESSLVMQSVLLNIRYVLRSTYVPPHVYGA